MVVHSNQSLPRISSPPLATRQERAAASASPAPARGRGERGPGSARGRAEEDEVVGWRLGGAGLFSARKS